MEEIKKRIETMSKNILNCIEKVDQDIESVYSDGYYEIHATPFIYDMYLEIKDQYIDFSSKRPRCIFNLYNIYPLSFIELPLIRGVRTKLDTLDLSSKVIGIKKLQTKKGDSILYKKYPGTLITYGIVDIIENIKLPFILDYFTYLYSKPLLHVETIKFNKNLWHLNVILPNITSFLTISNDLGEYEYLMPFSGVIFLDYSNKKFSQRRIFGYNIKCLELAGHLLFINRNTLEVRYFGPFPIIIPKTTLTDDTLINVNHDIVITHVQGFINFKNKGYLINNIKQKSESGYILILCEIPFFLELYVLANFGSIQFEKIKLLNEYIEIPKIVIDLKKINKINRNIEHAINVYTKKRYFHNKSILNKINNRNYLSSNEIMKHIQIEGSKLWMYHPTFISYLSFSKCSISEIKNLMEIDNFTNKLGDIQYITSNLIQSFKLYKKIVGIERKITKKYKLWLGI
ncbi:hypothetical protein [Methanocaldococcus sp.]